MIMYIIWITLEKLVYKDVEGKPISISKEHIVAFQIGLVFHSVHDHTIPAQTLKEFFKHSAIIQDFEYLVKSLWRCIFATHLLSVHVFPGMF